MASDLILGSAPLGFQWQTLDPFLFCVHHDDAYPMGDDQMAPAASLAGRNIGNDFQPIDGWRMYHGDVIPGFPQHPHRGFETVTIVRKGFIDHSDSLGAAARFGPGDVQWLTAGKGIVHSEMFPLRSREKSNPLELFQIWLNLPAASKFVEPHFSMLWNGMVPKLELSDSRERKTRVNLIAGQLGNSKAPPPPPESWASNPSADLAIWTITMEPGAEFVIPPAQAGSNRALYFFEGQSLEVGGHAVGPSQLVLDAAQSVTLLNGGQPADLLLLQGRPIGEPVSQYGPFVMNTPQEIQQAFSDYQATRFGGWPWPVDGPVHPREQDRFARHPDGRIEAGV